MTDTLHSHDENSEPEYPESFETREPDAVEPAGWVDADVARADAVPTSGVPEADDAPPRRARQWPRLTLDRGDAFFNVLLILVLFAAGWLRFDHQNWDDYTHLHPDERFLTEVVTLLNSPALSFTDPTAAEQEAHRLTCEQRYPAQYSEDDLPVLERPAGIGGYFDAECSALNPNNLGKGLYVYGEFPLFTVHAAGVARSRLSQDYHAYLKAFDPDAANDHVVTTHWEGYSGAQLIGRSVAAVADWLTVLVLFLLGRRLYGRWTGLLAAALYAFAAFPLQQSSFWTVDTFTTFWVTLSLYFAARALDDATAVQGPRPALYLALWGIAVVWQTGTESLPVLGLVSLGAIWLVVLALAVMVRGLLAERGAVWGEMLFAGSAVAASMLYLIGWFVMDQAAVESFALAGDLQMLGLASLVLAVAALIGFVVADVLNRQGYAAQGERNSTLAAGAIAIMEIALILTWAVGGLAALPAIFLGCCVVVLVVLDMVDLADYAWFGVVLGATVATRINMAPLAGIILVVAGLRMLPAFDMRLDRVQRNRIMAYALTGVMAAALLSFVVFRSLQPHAFKGPGFFGLQINPGWQDDASEAAYLTSGEWDAPPNHQWADRLPYWFPWRNMVLWGMGLPLGLLAWIAWAWAGVRMIRARAEWTRHAIPFLWVLVVFGWLGGRWVGTMRYFLPIYPALILFAAWSLVTLLTRAWRGLQNAARSSRSVTRSRLLAGAAVGLALIVIGYTVLYGLAFQNIHRHQLTRVAASRWFQEHVPGDFGLWVEGDDGTQQLVNLGRGYVASPPDVVHLNTGQVVTFDALPGQLDPLSLQPVPFTVRGDHFLSQITLRRLGDPELDAEPENVRVRLIEYGPSGAPIVLFENTITADFAEATEPYGQAYTFEPDDEVLLTGSEDPNTPGPRYTVEITVVDGGPIFAVGGVYDGVEVVGAHVGVTLVDADSGMVSVQDFEFEPQPILTGHGNDIPDTPTHWTVGGSDSFQFPVPIDGVIRTVEIPHLGDVLRDSDAETLNLKLVGPDGTTTTASVTADFNVTNSDAGPMGAGHVLTLDQPLTIKRYDAAGTQQYATLYVEAQDPVYTSGPVVAWEGDWDDPVPWPTCPLPLELPYRDDLESGLSDWTCGAVGMYSSYYQGLKLWMVAEDNDQKKHAMLNALDQADYIVITSNRFYDSLARIPYRWPMTKVYYDALFSGDLGFELVKTFESPPRIGPITFKDQILPTDDLPGWLDADWLNDQWEAEEAFHVYDHPAVLVFRKTDAYSPEYTRALLDSVSLRPMASTVYPYVADSEPLGVVPWGAKRASEVPTLLQLPDNKQEIQTDNGTWSELFSRDNPLNQSQPLAVIAWWLLMVVAGWIAWPLLFAVLPALPDRAYPAAKITAWLVVAWVAWVGGTFNVRLWSRGGLLLLLLLLAALSAAVVWRRRADFVTFIRANWRYLLAVEVLTLGLFGLALIIRLGNPDLWHYALGGEKPMDFAYFNGVLRSTVFPPLDPWFAGGYLNYYYFGYVVVGAPVKLLGLDPALAYNIIIPTLFALTGIGVFTVAYNWVRARAMTPGSVLDATTGTSGSEPETGRDDGFGLGGHERRAPRGSAWAAGLIALALAMILGNLGELHLFVTSVAQMDGWERQPLYSQYRRTQLESQRSDLYNEYYAEAVERFQDEHDGRSPETPDEQFLVTQRAQTQTDAHITAKTEHPPILKQWAYDLNNTLDQMRHFAGGIGKFLRGDQLPLAPNRWYWAPTRLYTELPGGAGQNAIVEMPFFTFLYGDLHAHMLAFPLTLLVVLWVLGEIIGAGHGLRTDVEAFLALALGAITVGVLRPTNSWDWITYLLAGGAGLTYAAWLDATRASWGRPVSRAAQWVADWLRPHRARALWQVAFVVPVMIVLRIGFYLLQRIRADQQAQNGLKPGEELIDPALSVGSVLVWVIAGLALVVVFYLAVLIALRAHINRRVLVSWVGRIAGFVVISSLAAMPFTRYFATGYNEILPWERETTPLWAYLYVHGVFLFIVISFLGWQTARWLRTVRVGDLQGQAVPVLAVVGGLVIVLFGSLVYGAREAPVAQLVVPLVTWALLLFFVPGQAPLLRLVYAVIVLALAISFGVELVVLEGDIGRQNTVFKFYLQVWFLLSIVGGVTLAWLLRTLDRWPWGWRGVWQTGLSALVAVALMFPILATQGRWQDRFDQNLPTTLDGMDYMQSAIHSERGISFALRDDYVLIRWLQDNVDGTPVIMEAQMPGEQYRWSNRISIYTGLPSVLGWSWHQIQQHSYPDLDKLVHTRENNIAAFYSMTGAEGIQAAVKLIRHYEVEYIIVGTLERIVYGDIVRDPGSGEVTIGGSDGLAKFEQMADSGLLDVVYTREHCLSPGITDVSVCPENLMVRDVVYRVVDDVVEQVALGVAR